MNGKTHALAVIEADHDRIHSILRLLQDEASGPAEFERVRSLLIHVTGGGGTRGFRARSAMPTRRANPDATFTVPVADGAETIKRLGQYIALHHRFEELQAEAAGTPIDDAHRSMHHELHRYIRHLWHDMMRFGDDPALFWIVGRLISNILVEHMCTEDRQLLGQLKSGANGNGS